MLSFSQDLLCLPGKITLSFGVFFVVKKYCLSVMIMVFRDIADS